MTFQQQAVHGAVFTGVAYPAAPQPQYPPSQYERIPPVGYQAPQVIYVQQQAPPKQTKQENDCASDFCLGVATAVCCRILLS